MSVRHGRVVFQPVEEALEVVDVAPNCNIERHRFVAMVCCGRRAVRTNRLKNRFSDRIFFFGRLDGLALAVGLALQEGR